MAPALIRDAFIGDVLYHVSGHRLFQHPEDRSGFTIPTPPRSVKSTASRSSSHSNLDTFTVIERPDDEESRLPRVDSDQVTITVPEASEEQRTMQWKAPEVEEGDLAKEKEKSSVMQEIAESRIVEWYGPNDSENPQNWSLAKKSFVTFQVCLLTFSVYIGSAIYSPGIDEIAAQFGVSPVAATLGLTLFVVGYGIGPMFLSPLSELPQIGRTTVYILSLALFVVLQVPTALAKNLGALLPLRFVAGFAGSPALATGGASLSDVWAPEHRAVVIGLWSVAGISGPVLGPLLGGFATQGEDWTWTIWILLWMSGATLVFLTLFFPETSASALLYRRAARLRRVTEDSRLKSEGEIEVEHMTVGDIAMMHLVRPFILMFVEPIVAFWNIYIALVYGILYIFIESFRVVFVEKHGFNLGENGLAFLGIFAGTIITFAFFAPYALRVLKPKFVDNTFVPEMRLPIAFVGSVLLPISMFWFGWTSSASVHWIVPIIASAFFSAGTYMLFQAGLNYLADCYPRYVASVLAGNDFFRSMVGAAFPLFSTAFFHNLGVGPACSILGGVAVLMLPIPWILHRYGARIRSWSKYAN
ncbi:uncharacterized protein PHACADRAFT_208428 [Phanerochaete carnosa HHB-10118-sp]|uniref:Major facilitator superfamily (MFS) profile domain-containing protein n=1 Tax=Phanerochaete carnosa (strain HHB-10118-sp) TaxID=650164 RepID=K5X3H5_PHACS|nr:uncharacterized protein PHACADRAFT_208428 [Phanerochaete carnosa HHB-10118-sp]EKM57337.1 hypothetical protein PHACADRAFT_208428 [Phanerochaete carnosa HHB-10118-sp]